MKGPMTKPNMGATNRTRLAENLRLTRCAAECRWCLLVAGWNLPELRDKSRPVVVTPEAATNVKSRGDREIGHHKAML
jgi:hypothetical protein